MSRAQQKLEDHGLGKLGGLAPAAIHLVKALLESSEGRMEGVLTQVTVVRNRLSICLALALYGSDEFLS